MRPSPVLAALAFLLHVLVSPANANPDPTPDPNAATVFVEKDCGLAGAETKNCFEELALVTSWIASTRLPNEDAPLLVQIGPGSFGRIRCIGWGHVTFRGAGREATSLYGFYGSVIVEHCSELEFQNMTIGAVGGIFGVAWTGGGTSIWSNTDIFARRAAWYDECDESMPIGAHYFFSSRLEVRPKALQAFGSPHAVGYYTNCGEGWLYGTDISLKPYASDPPTTLGQWQGVNVSGRGDLRVFGSTIRVVSGPIASGNPGSSLRGVVVGLKTEALAFGIGTEDTGDGTFHMHGGIVAVDGSSLSDTDVVSIDVAQGGDAFVHMPDTAFSLKPSATGAVSRIRGKGAHSPFLWPAATDPPGASRLTTKDGHDLYVETDCAASGDCAGAGNEPHLMTYAEAMCGSVDPWFDIATGRCRNDTAQ